MRKKLIVGNWKMHLNLHQSSLLLHKLTENIVPHTDVEVVLGPNFVALQSLSLQINHRQFKLAAQNCQWRDDGPYTGEISATMLRGLTQYIIVGHSERRNVFGETLTDVRNKVQAVVRNNMKPILCIGETAHERADGETNHVLHDQITSGLANVTSEEIDRITIAYEPVWAIGTGDSATSDDVAKAVGIIRKQVSSLFGQKAADALRVLYGGSVNQANAADYLSIDGVDGLLVGGASIKAAEFTKIVGHAHRKVAAA